MAKHENLPFPRGRTWYDGRTIDSTNLGGENLLGLEQVHEDLNFGATGLVKPARSGQLVKVVAVRNYSAGALLPKRLVSLRAVAGKYTGEVDGYTTTTAAAFLGVVDEFLPAAGCPQYDICWVVVEGPTTVLTDLAGGANNVFAIGDVAVALTAATSGATTAGRVKPQDLTGATAVLGAEVINMVGRALSAKTTTQTNGDLYINVRRYF